MKIIFFKLLLISVILIPGSLSSQLASDTLLFTISLTENTNSIFTCNNPGDIQKTLAGPILMADESLLFYSEYGYVLYNQTGKQIDSHSLFQLNSGVPPDDPKRIRLAYPSDPLTIIYYQKIANEYSKITLFSKNLFKTQLEKIINKDYYNFYPVINTHLFNLAHNTITDDMLSTHLVKPHLVGYTNSKIQMNWWSLDKYYSFSLPLINEQNGEFHSFFPGTNLKNEKRPHKYINPIKVFNRDNKWYFTGVYSTVGRKDKKYMQTLLFFDSGGNLLYSDSLLKQVNKDEVIGKYKNTYYTVKNIERYVFQPTSDSNGNIYYGTIDYTKKTITVRKREYYIYKPVPTEPDLAHLIDVEKGIKYVPIGIKCNMELPGGKAIPLIKIIDSKGKKIIAKASHLTRQGYLARISRNPYRDNVKKIFKGNSELPEHVQEIIRSMRSMPTVFCPYTISISGPKGMIRSFRYSPGEQIFCARVLVVREENELVIRVDCRNFAEILILKTDGSFVNRFIFNRQHYSKRKDIIVADEKSPIIELDFENENEKQSFFKWEQVIQS